MYHNFASNVCAKTSLRVSVVQYPVEANHEIATFLGKIEKYVKKAKDQEGDLVLLPEWVTLDVWQLKNKMSDKEVISYVADKVTPKYLKYLKRLSKKLKIIIAGGSTALKEANKIYNAAFMVFPDGQLHIHRKVYLTKWERKHGITPGKSVTVVKTEWGNMALLTCYDVEFPDLSVQMAKQEVNLLLVPSMTESKEGLKRVRWTSQARAVEHTTYVAISPTVGSPSKGWVNHGQAAFLSPQIPGFQGILKEGRRNKSGIYTYQFDMAKLIKAKKESSWRPAKDMK